MLRVNYFVDSTLKDEKDVQNIEELLICLKRSTRVYIDELRCQLEDIDYTIESNELNVWLVEI